MVPTLTDWGNDMMNKGIRKRRSTAGETIVETLMALLVVVMAMTLLAGAIVSAARVNSSTEKMDVALNVTEDTSFVENKTTVTITHSIISARDESSVADTLIEVDEVTTGNGYVFYQRHE